MATLGHINIATARLDETITFYCDLLDLHPGEAATRPGASEFVWLFDRQGNPWIHLRRTAVETQFEVGGPLNHIAFNHDDAEAAEEFLRSARISYTRVDTAVTGVFQFNLKDPNGIPIELTFAHEKLRKNMSQPAE